MFGSFGIRQFRTRRVITAPEKLKWTSWVTWTRPIGVPLSLGCSPLMGVSIIRELPFEKFTSDPLVEFGEGIRCVGMKGTTGPDSQVRSPVRKKIVCPTHRIKLKGLKYDFTRNTCVGLFISYSSAYFRLDCSEMFSSLILINNFDL